MSTVIGDRTEATREPARRSTELSIGGMTCASCAARVEKKLKKLDGVTATVNFATETARVTFPRAVAPAQLVAAVEQVGYTAVQASAGPGAAQQGGEAVAAEPDDTGSLRQRLLVSLVLAIPVVQFRGWQWASLALASPVATWGAWPFHRAAFANARHGAATMDTLISIG